jgi:hypothetical protein
VKLRKAMRRAKTAEERQQVEAMFKEMVFKLKEAIEGSAEKDRLSDEDIGNLLERLAGLVQYIGQGYRTAEVKSMLDESYMGYATRMRLKGEQEGERKGVRKGAAERRRLEKENERLRWEIEKLKLGQQTAGQQVARKD